MTKIDLSRLREPFPPSDIEWRVTRSGMSQGSVWCAVVAYITARAIAQRLDDVCGVDGWRNEEPRLHVMGQRHVFVCGLTIDTTGDGDWLTKWDVAEPTDIEPAKGGFSGALKRAGAQWGIGRYLYHLEETFAETSDRKGSGWKFAKLSKKYGEQTYYWKPPQLPSWALPKDTSVSPEVLKQLKSHWRRQCAPDITDAADLREGFARFVTSIVGSFPLDDHSCWTTAALEKCIARLDQPESGGVDGDVPFE